MSYNDKIRLIRVQEQLSIARNALKQINDGASFPESIASLALEEIERADVKEGGKWPTS